MTYTQAVSLDVAREQALYISAKQYDSNSRFLAVTITEQGVPTTIAAGSTATINARRPDGSTQSFAGTITLDGKVSVPIDSWILEQYGTVYCSISVVDSNSAKITTLSFRLIVERSEGNGYILVYTASAALSAGTYYITLAGTNYQFTTTQTIPIGGKIYFSSTYATGKTTTQAGAGIETLTLTTGSSGTQLTGSDVINFLASFMGSIAELGNKADKVGEFPDLVAGSAEALLAGGEEALKTYAVRGVPTVRRAKINKIIGATVAWNQLIQDGNFPDSTKWTATGTGAVLTVANNVATMHRDSATSATINLALGTSYRPQSVSGHKYLFAATIEAAVGQINLIPTGSTTDGQMGYITLAAKTRIGYLWSCSVDKPIQTTVRGYTGAGVTSTIDYTVENYICIDLTAALGPIIADYLATLESNTPGAGVAKFRELFPEPYYDYCEPTLQSVCVSGHRCGGFNVWDEVWENGTLNITTGAKEPSTVLVRSKNYIPVLPNTAYYIKANAVVCFYDSGYGYISYAEPNNASFTTPSNAAFMLFRCANAYGNTYKGDISVNLSNPLLNGKYVPYGSAAYPIEPVELRGIYKLDSNNNIYADGDEYEADGSVKKKYGILTNQTGSVGDTITLTGAKSNLTDLVSTKGHLADIGTISGTTLTLTTALSGDDIVYELATPTTDSAEPFTAVQRFNNGEISFTDAEVTAGNRDVIVPPCTAVIEYPDTEAIAGKIPPIPTSAGNYTLQLTVGTDTASMSWV